MQNILHQFSRRKFLGGLGAGLAAAVFARGSDGEAAAAAEDGAHKHLAWVWQFNDDGPRDVIRSVLAHHNLGIILKTHDGTSWMSRWDKSPDAIRGPEDIRNLANYFETNGVPFHVWSVVRGLDPRGEAQMCAEALANGARSMVLDLEPNDGGHYWQGGPGDAIAFGQELRRLAPSAAIAVAPDPRPWQVDAVPMAEFASFSNSIAPQTYWQTFNSSANYRLLRERGFYVGPEGVTPELILDVTAQVFGRFNLPIWPIGQGAADRDGWQRFVQHAQRLGMPHVAVWRYGTATRDVWPVLGDMAPPAPPAPAPPPEPAAEPEPQEVPTVIEATAASAFPAYRLSDRNPAKSGGSESSDDSKQEKSQDKNSSSTKPRVKETGLFGAKGVSKESTNKTTGRK